MIELDDVSLDRSGRRVLTDLTCRIEERRVGIIGANGSGKSSFARLLNGLLLPTQGAVRVNSFDTRQEGKTVRRQVGFLFQNPDNQIVYPTVAEDLAFGLKNRGMSKSECAARVTKALAERGLAGFEERLIHELSGGERQLVALAGILVLEPALLVLDEPTTLLDLPNTRRLMQALDEVSAKVVMLTHDLPLLDSFDRVVCFADGRIVADGEPAEVVNFYRQLSA
ncbi:ABC transporter ATP-binding protein [Aureimonas fodinaquatilis]|uniref:ABC transporter ATP-binding protein n=1 Tax=Aureimonas fodinaquatilis TaxID=2565783 RepID=A0A5B0DYT9_9HYPH|nr:ABC transporter ATP-binding protein [Aureimonas fodinaquatilis]KAA0971015.1 ABC transporter ATP-binding protein [Aureimonas fodinaquatilis]